MPRGSSSSGGGKGTRKYGRNKLICQRYKDRNTRFKNKLKRVRQSSGKLEAIKYEDYYNVHGTQKGYKPHRRRIKNEMSKMRG